MYQLLVTFSTPLLSFDLSGLYITGTLGSLASVSVSTVSFVPTEVSVFRVSVSTEVTDIRVSVSTEERKLADKERPLFVQLNWGKDDREGRFLLRNEDHNKNVPVSVGI